MTADLEAQLDALTSKLERLENEVANGDMVDLSGLDSEVADACDMVAAQNAETVEALQPRLDALLAGMDRLEARVREQFEGIRAELNSHGRRSQATRAYAQWMSSNAPNDK